MKVHQPNGQVERIDSKDLVNVGVKPDLISSEAFEKNMNKELSEKEIYNESLFLIKDKEELDKINLVGNYFLFRPFKIVEIKTKSGLILTMAKEKVMDKNSMKVKYENLPFPYQTSGVIVKAPSKPLLGYEFVKEGTVVDLPHRSMPQIPNMIYKMNKNIWEPEDNEEYLTLIIPISMIESYR